MFQLSSYDVGNWSTVIKFWQCSMYIIKNYFGKLWDTCDMCHIHELMRKFVRIRSICPTLRICKVHTVTVSTLKRLIHFQNRNKSHTQKNREPGKVISLKSFWKSFNLELCKAKCEREKNMVSNRNVIIGHSFISQKWIINGRKCRCECICIFVVRASWAIWRPFNILRWARVNVLCMNKTKDRSIYCIFCQCGAYRLSHLHIVSNARLLAVLPFMHWFVLCVQCVSIHFFAAVVVVVASKLFSAIVDNY